jgi:hypothetical protein
MQVKNLFAIIETCSSFNFFSKENVQKKKPETEKQIQIFPNLLDNLAEENTLVNLSYLNDLSHSENDYCCELFLLA